MDMFNFSGKKCTCPHCRGGHALNDIPIDPIEYQEGSNIEIENNVSRVDIERHDPDELVRHYIEVVLECETPEDVEEVMQEFFDEVFLYALQETYINEIEGKIMALNLMKNGLDEEE